MGEVNLPGPVGKAKNISYFDCFLSYSIQIIIALVAGGELNERNCEISCSSNSSAKLLTQVLVGPVYALPQLEVPEPPLRQEHDVVGRQGCGDGVQGGAGAEGEGPAGEEVEGQAGVVHVALALLRRGPGVLDQAGGERVGEPAWFF